MKIETVEMPEHWASALVNHDFSGCPFDDAYRITVFKLDNPQFGPCLMCSENSFIGRYEGKLCTMLEYSFPVLETPV